MWRQRENRSPRSSGFLPQLPAVFDRAGTPADDPARRVPEIQKAQMEAVILSAEGHGDQAIATMQQAIASGKDLPYAFGPPSPEKPSEELLGELLLKANKAAQAREAFAASLRARSAKDRIVAGAGASRERDGRPSGGGEKLRGTFADLEECRSGLCAEGRGAALCFQRVARCELEKRYCTRSELRAGKAAASRRTPRLHRDVTFIWRTTGTWLV